MAKKCLKCNADNPDTQSYCGDCGTRLGIPEDILVHTKTLETPFPQFSPGTSLAGRYEVIKELGKGGMGEVYLAEDTNLMRQVAIKVLPREFALNKERLARFEREARVLASLNHPNIATIHGLEKEHGQQILVMELVEGETLAERLETGPLTVEEALGVCRQIAEGLEFAHEKGIIHRDLKPGNIKITTDGTVKILDFGLAKVYQEEPEAIDLSKSPTLTDRMTQPGVILGTAAYMSPEQARSRPVDKRADIWAFGCVLYECLTGKIVFQGETFTDTLAHILKSEPDWTKLPLNTPASIRVLIRRCLQKNPRMRLHDIADARIEITEPSDIPTKIHAVRRFPWGWLLAGALALLFAGIIIGSLVEKSTGNVFPAAPVRSVIKLNPGHILSGWRRLEFNWPTRTSMAISREGEFIVYCAVKEGNESGPKEQLYLRRLSELEATPIEGTEWGTSPFLSPDDQWIGFWREEKLWKVPVGGGVPQDLCEATRPFGASWGEDNMIVFSSDYLKGLSRIPAGGGEPEVLTIPDQNRKEFSHRIPDVLPHGKGILFTIMHNRFDLHPSIAFLDLKTREWRVLIDDGADACYIPTGHLIFLRRGTLMAIPFDTNKPYDLGPPVPVVSDVMHALNITNAYANTGSGFYSISNTGRLVYVSGGIFPDKKHTLVWLDQKGAENTVGSLSGYFFCPRLSPDDQKIAYSTIGKEWRVWLYDTERDISEPLTSEGLAVYPNWDPDGKRLAFSWTQSGAFDLHLINVEGSPKMELLYSSEIDKYSGSWSPNGDYLAFVEEGEKSVIFLLNVKEKSVQPFSPSDFNQIHPEYSPDGHCLAYCSDVSGQYEVYVRSLSPDGRGVQVSRNGGMAPIWARDGKQLFYRSGPQVWVVEIQTSPVIKSGIPRLLYERAGYASGTPIRAHDLSPDGQNMLMVKEEEINPRPVTEMNLVQNWFEEVKRLVPTGK